MGTYNRKTYSKLGILLTLALAFSGCPSKEKATGEADESSELDCSSAAAMSNEKCKNKKSLWQALADSPQHMRNMTSGYSYPDSGRAVYWTGNKILAWGDYNYVGGNRLSPMTITANGELYDPKKNTWASISSVNGPSARTNFASAFTGSELIVWGGRDSSDFVFNDGGIYNVATNSWSSISLKNAPSARISANSVWTGTQLIVWGGQNDFTSHNLVDGAIYNRASNTWSAISKTNAPSSRRFASAVWTGKEMIIWGGAESAVGPSTGVIGVATGSRYNPTTNTWVSMSNVGAPSGRQNHTAIWTGSKMLIWGGGNAWDSTNDFRNDGFAYDPETDTWTPMSQINAPAPRSYQGSVWTGSRLVVYGGRNYTTNKRDGGIYDPATNKWEAIPETDDSPARVEPVLLWGDDALYVSSGYEDIYFTVRSYVYNFKNKLKDPPEQNFAPEPAAPEMRWSRTTLNPNLEWSAVGYGNNTYVAFARDSNQFAKSSDGYNWTYHTHALSGYFKQIIYAGGLFIVTKEDASSIATSSDAVTWTNRPVPAGFFRSLVYGNGKFVFLDRDGKVAISTDAIHWTQASTPFTSATTMAFGNGLFVALRHGPYNQVAISADAVTWSVHNLPTTASTVGWSGLVFGNGKFLAINTENYLGISAMSDDGIHWVEKNMPVATTWWDQVSFGNGKFVAISASSGGISATSADGETWNLYPMHDQRHWSSPQIANDLVFTWNFSGSSYGIDTGVAEFP